MSYILCFGDSNTYGYDPRDGGRYDSKYRWCDILASYGHTVVNEGLNGREIPTSIPEYGYLNAIINRNSEADILILALGVNDAYNFRHGTAKKIADRWREVFKNVSSLKRFHKDNKQIVLISPPIGPADVWGEDRIEEIEDTLAELSGEYKALAQELEIEFADAGTWNVELAFDGVHFTETGNVAFAKSLREMLKI